MEEGWGRSEEKRRLFKGRSEPGRLVEDAEQGSQSVREEGGRKLTDMLSRR